MSDISNILKININLKKIYQNLTMDEILDSHLILKFLIIISPGIFHAGREDIYNPCIFFLRNSDNLGCKLSGLKNPITRIKMVKQKQRGRHIPLVTSQNLKKSFKWRAPPAN
jgi:hypothetical protein